MMNQLLIAIWRARRFATARFDPNIATNTGAVVSGLMIGKSVTGTKMSALRNGMINASTDSPWPPLRHPLRSRRRLLPAQPGRVGLPERAGERRLVPDLVQLGHLDRVENLGAGEVDVLGDGDTVEGRRFAQRDRVDPEEVTDHRRAAGALEDARRDPAQRPPGRAGRRDELAVVDDEDVHPPHPASSALADRRETEHAAAQEDAGRDRPV